MAGRYVHVYAVYRVFGVVGCTVKLIFIVVTSIMGKLFWASKYCVFAWLNQYMQLNMYACAL